MSSLQSADAPIKPPLPPSGNGKTGKSAAGAAGLVGIAVMCSRVLGLARDLIFAGFFGAEANTDAFQMAFRVPNLLRDLFAEGALSTAFITVFSRKIATEGDRSAWALANKVATLNRRVHERREPPRHHFFRRNSLPS